MQTTIIHSDPPRRDQRHTGGSLTGCIAGDEPTDIILLAKLLELFSDFFDCLIDGLSREGLGGVFDLVGDQESEVSLHFMLNPNGKTIMLDFEVRSWVYELPENAFHDYFFMVMKPNFLEIFREFSFNDSTTDPEAWFKMMHLGAILFHKNSG